MIKDQLFPNGGFSDSLSSFSGFSQMEREIKEEVVKSGMRGIGVSERTSLLHEEVQLSKYREVEKITDPDILNIEDDFNSDADLAPFRTEKKVVGIRQRSQQEIEKSISRFEQQRLENKMMLKENNQLFSELNELNLETEIMTDKIN